MEEKVQEDIQFDNINDIDMSKLEEAEQADRNEAKPEPASEPYDEWGSESKSKSAMNMKNVYLSMAIIFFWYMTLLVLDTLGIISGKLSMLLGLPPVIVTLVMYFRIHNGNSI